MSIWKIPACESSCGKRNEWVKTFSMAIFLWKDLLLQSSCVKKPSCVCNFLCVGNFSVSEFLCVQISLCHDSSVHVKAPLCKGCSFCVKIVLCRSVRVKIPVWKGFCASETVSLCFSVQVFVREAEGFHGFPVKFRYETFPLCLLTFLRFWA